MLPGGSPTHVAPVGFFFPGSVATVSVARAFPSVTGGPVTASGRIDLDSPGLARAENSGLLAATVRSGGRGSMGSPRAPGPDSRFAGYAGLSGAAFGDYRTGGGDWVDADLEMVGLAGSMVWAGSDDRSANLAFVVNRQLLARNASLPLDLKDTTMYAVTLDTAWESDASSWSVRVGYTDNSPFLTSEDRPIVPGAPVDVMTAEAKATNLQWRDFADLASGCLGHVGSGTRFQHQNRDAVRHRLFLSGMQFNDHIWPEVWSSDLGLFGEVRWDESDRWRMVGGVRLDRVWSDADAADDPVVGLPGARGATIRRELRGVQWAGCPDHGTERLDRGRPSPAGGAGEVGSVSSVFLAWGWFGRRRV